MDRSREIRFYRLLDSVPRFSSCFILPDPQIIANISPQTAVGVSVEAVRTTVPRAQGVPMYHRQHHLPAPFKAVHHPQILHQESLRSQIRLRCPRRCQ